MIALPSWVLEFLEATVDLVNSLYTDRVGSACAIDGVAGDDRVSRPCADIAFGQAGYFSHPSPFALVIGKADEGWRRQGCRQLPAPNWSAPLRSPGRKQDAHRTECERRKRVLRTAACPPRMSLAAANGTWKGPISNDAGTGHAGWQSCCAGQCCDQLRPAHVEHKRAWPQHRRGKRRTRLERRLARAPTDIDDIAAIGLELDSGAEDPFVKGAVILFANGERLRILVELNRPKETAIYREFVTEFFERLGPAQRQRIIFREGPSRARRMVSIIFCVVLLVLLVGVLLFGVVSGGFFQEENGWLGIPLALLLATMLSGVLWRTLKSEQTTFDPQAIP